ncbi:MAG: sialidase family protein [Pirellulales bacterium]
MRMHWLTGCLAACAIGGAPACADDTAAGIEIVTVAEATDEHPRHSEGSAVELKDGSLLLVWQEFSPGSGDSDFFPSRLAARTSRDGGRTWGDHRVLVETRPGDVNVFSPNLLRLPDGTILFCFMRYESFDKAKNKYPPTSAEAWLSRDEGRTFEPLAHVWQTNMNAFASSVIKRAASGRILLPVNRDLSERGQNDHWEGGLVYSDDGGRTWTESDGWVDLPMRGAMESHVDELRDGRLLMVMRTQLGAVFQAESPDGGRTWSKPQTTGLRSPESCPDLVRIPGSSDLLLVWNNSPYDPKHYSHFGKRTPLSVAISRDDGRTWGNIRDIETDPGWAFSNPGCCFTSQRTVLINYWACRYQESGAMSNFPIHLKAAIVDLDWLYGSTPAGPSDR